MKKTKAFLVVLLAIMTVFAFAACGGDDKSATDTSSDGAGIPKEDIKVGVVHIGDPADGSGYSYTHDLGIQGMQKNIGLSDDQIHRELNVADDDANAIRTAIEN